MRTPYRAKTGRKPYKAKPMRTPYQSKTHKGKRKNAKSGINSLRELLLGANKVLGDVNALNKGTVVDRVVRRIGGKIAGSGLGNLDKK
jgi:hypothetical protein